jgi:hypothetical protein
LVAVKWQRSKDLKTEVLEEYVYTTLATFGIEESLRKGMPLAVDLASIPEKV